MAGSEGVSMRRGLLIFGYVTSALFALVALLSMWGTLVIGVPGVFYLLTSHGNCGVSIANDSVWINGRWWLTDFDEFRLHPWPGLVPRWGVICLPNWLAFVLWLGGIAWLQHLTRRRRAAHECACGYDLTGNTSGTCPECGCDTTHHPPGADVV